MDRHLQFLSCMPEDGRAALAPTLDSLGLSTRAFHGFRLRAEEAAASTTTKTATCSAARAGNHAPGHEADRKAVKSKNRTNNESTSPGQREIPDVGGQGAKVSAKSTEEPVGPKPALEQQAAGRRASLGGANECDESETAATLKQQAATTAVNRWADAEYEDEDIHSFEHECDDAETKEECRSISSWASTHREMDIVESPNGYIENPTFVILKSELNVRRYIYTCVSMSVPILLKGDFKQLFWKRDKSTYTLVCIYPISVVAERRY